MIMSRVVSTTLAAAVSALLIAGPALAQEGHGGPLPEREKWSFAGTFGRFDTAQLQRGFQVYKEVCSACHSMKARLVPQPRAGRWPGFLGRSGQGVGRDLSG